MYKDTITLFNRYESKLGDTWYPSVLKNVNLNTDKRFILTNYGADSQDNAVLNVKYTEKDGQIMIGDKKWLSPIRWDEQTNDLLPGSLTFYGGNEFDFFWVGEWPDEEPISDEEYGGFYSYMSKNHDDVFRITSVSRLSVIPHFEIVGR